MNNDCIFCRIGSGEEPTPKLFEDEHMFIIRDISPRAKLHYLMIPKKHYKLLTDMSGEDSLILGKCLKKLSGLTKELGLENGYRLTINQGDDGRQTVFHLHVHVQGGEKLPI